MNNSTDLNLPNIKIYDPYNFQLIKEFNILKPMKNNQMIHKVQIIDQQKNSYAILTANSSGVLNIYDITNGTLIK